MRRTSLITGLLVVFISLVGLLLFGPKGEGSSPLPTPPTGTEVPSGEAFLAGMLIYGGMCPEESCEQGYMITNDGTLLFGLDELKPVGTVPPEQIAELRSAITTDVHPAMDIAPFEGTCATAVDGVAFVFYFYGDEGMAELDSCQWDVSQLKSALLVQDIISDYLELSTPLTQSDT